MNPDIKALCGIVLDEYPASDQRFLVAYDIAKRECPELIADIDSSMVERNRPPSDETMKINFSNHNIVNTAPVWMMFDRPMLERFKVVITKADEAKAETIRFDGNEFDVAYGKYLIEYLETKLKP